MSNDHQKNKMSQGKKINGPIESFSLLIVTIYIDKIFHVSPSNLYLIFNQTRIIYMK